ncbi:MAG: IPT/TIG domain-containing protein [Deltaproteobacteria bacterium]|nr:IPT/TIG domain-containing protein [Deltaproteobacteria bacterium]MBN2670352.1 IPT/TIG domain-containing protein [Deltaproteobacteria bacterium]
MKKNILILGFIVLTLSLFGCDKPLGVKDISPKTGNLGGGEPLEIIGSGFHNNMGISVYIGGNKVDNVSIQGTEKLIVSTPPGNAPGPVDIRITFDNGDDDFLISGGFTYVKESGGAMDIRAIGTRKSQREKE